MRRFSSCARRKAGWASRRWRSDRVRGGGPHYKFNLTNGSENLETMEYMKCGRVYHVARHGVVPAAILSGPIHILRERAGGWGPARSRGRGNIGGRVERKAKHAVGKTRSRETRMVPVAFQPARVAPRFWLHIGTELSSTLRSRYVVKNL